MTDETIIGYMEDEDQDTFFLSLSLSFSLSPSLSRSFARSLSLSPVI